LLVEVCAPAGEALNDDVGEVSLQVAEVVGHVALDQSQGPIESRDYIGRVDVGTRVIDDDRDPAHGMAADSFRRALSADQAQKLGEHDMKIV
jgi:hypothetical protein